MARLPMPRGVWMTALGLCLGLGAIASAGCLHAPMAWSPDGRWIAYAVASRPLARALPPGWLLAPDAEESSWDPSTTARRRGPDAAGAEDVTYRLWATRVEDSTSVLLDESRGPISAAGWSPDGSALAYARVVRPGEDESRYEVVVLDAARRARIVWSQPLGPDRANKSELSALPGLAVAWSPDGRHLAAPRLRPSGLAILRADSGRLVKSIDDAYLPSWSPDGSTLAVFRASADGTGADEIGVLENGLGAVRPLKVTGPASQPAVWSRDGRFLTVVHRRGIAPIGTLPSEQAELIRVRVETGGAEKVRVLVAEPARPGTALDSVGYALDGEGADLVYTVSLQGRPNVLVWCRPQDNITFDQFNPFDLGLALGGLAVAPSGQRLAVRVGPAGPLAPPAWIDLTSKKPTLLAPDDAARGEWLTTLVAEARRLIRVGIPGPHEGPGILTRPSLLPAPGEIPFNDERGFRLRKLALLARPFCDALLRDATPGLDPAARTSLLETRLFLAYLLEDYPAALAALEELDPEIAEPADRRRLLLVRAQVALGQGDHDRARGVIAYLQSRQSGPVRRIEITSLGPKLTDLPDPESAWTNYLAARLRASAVASGLAAGDRGTELEVAPGFEAGFPGGGRGLPLEPQGPVPAGLPLPQRQMIGDQEINVPFRVERREERPRSPFEPPR